MARSKIGIVFGGCSEEHPISVKSAQEVAQEPRPEKYEPFYIGITSDGAWKLCDGPDAGWEDGGRRPAVLSPDRSAPGLLVLEQGRYETIRLDVVLPVLHGKLGEDGAIQGLLELSGIPYVGCDIQSSALCMDKSLAYVVARSAGIATPKFWTVTANEKVDPDRLHLSRLREAGPLGLVVRRQQGDPERGAAERGGDRTAVRLEGADRGGRRRQRGRLRRSWANDPELIAGEVDRVALSHGFFRIHQEREPESGSENSTFIVPADIPAESRALVQETAKTIYRALGCRGLARVDMFLKEDGPVVLNEVNTLPGLTSYSRYPADDGGRGTAARRGDRPAGVAGAAREEAMNDDFVFVDEVVPGIRWDAKYATWDNFTGRPVDGYLANRIVGTSALCAALERRRRRPRRSASACCSGTATARNAPWTASSAGRKSRRTAARSRGTTRTSTGPRCSSRATWPPGPATAGAAPST